ncbi:glycosyltransferase family 48 protein [Suillus luteus UH-Slu-Lm8-n1]|uniref:1,3-beta-glucan synthase n=1 Tax=Suillus luteus UH-Slu-Lm8-n1 TaxID=930992 RepID=A0A0D0ASS4_9AGAM|nr:glycosyltransferase family 48 protein [Suillus luteus UH-Slu-Lm8-n1]
MFVEGAAIICVRGGTGGVAVRLEQEKSLVLSDSDSKDEREGISLCRALCGRPDPAGGHRSRLPKVKPTFGATREEQANKNRECYYLGTQLPVNRFLTFYYDHPGFYIKNMLVILAVQCFFVTMVFLGTLNSSILFCQYSAAGTIPPDVDSYYNLTPVFNWIHCCIISILLVFMIAFLSLFTQGRGFATTRISFSILFSRFARPSVDLGMRTLISLLYVTMALWTPYLIYFWISILALCVAPFLFNPHQFAFADFMIDYREFLRWMSRRNSRSHNNSWIGYRHLSRIMITGYKKKKLGLPSDKMSGDVPRAVLPTGKLPPNPLIRIAIIALGPIAWSAAVLLVQFIISVFLCPMMDPTFLRFGSVMTSTAHVLGVVGMLGFFEFLSRLALKWSLETWNASHAVLGIIAVIAIQRAVHNRASRKSPNQALLTLHADYIGAQLDPDDTVGHVENPGLQRLNCRAGARSSNEKSLATAMERWRQAMKNMSQYDRLRQIALCLLGCGEAAQYRSPECQNRVDPVPEGLYLKAVVKPLYEGIARIILTDKTRLVDLPPPHRFMKFHSIEWNRAFFKTYYEKHSFGHLLVNFNRIWVIHVSLYWFYTAHNSPKVYQISHPLNKVHNSPALSWPVTALGDAVATIIMIAATLAEFSSLALILGIVQFFISVVATLLFATMPSGRMFWDKVAGKSRKYLVSQPDVHCVLSRTANIVALRLYCALGTRPWLQSRRVLLFFTLSFRDPIAVMVGMKSRGDSAFFLDTFLWYIIWNTAFSIARSFILGLSIWTPWKNIYTRLPKRIYAKLLVTRDMEVYKLKVDSGHDGKRSLRAPPFLWTHLSFPGSPFSGRCIDDPIRSLTVDHEHWRSLQIGTIITAGEWLVDILCLVPIHIAVTMENTHVREWISSNVARFHGQAGIDELMRTLESATGWHMATSLRYYSHVLPF